jgi:hypothetical protein
MKAAHNAARRITVTNLRKKMALGVVTLAIAVSAFATGVPKTARAANSCDKSSPLLGAYAQYFYFNGNNSGMLYQIAAYGVWSSNHPANDCVYVDVRYTGQQPGRNIYADDGNNNDLPWATVSANAWYSPSPGVWTHANSYSVTYNPNLQPYPYVESAYWVTTSEPSWHADCFVVNASLPTADRSDFYDQFGSYYGTDVSGNSPPPFNIPGNNSSLICPTTT